MKPPRFAAVMTMLALAFAGGCGKKNNTPPSSESPSQPAAQGSAAAPASTPQSQPPASSAAPAAPNAASSATPAQPATPPPPAVVEIPAGTRVRVRLDEAVGSRISQPGQAFSATVADDVLVDGQTAIPRHSRARGTVLAAKPLGHVAGRAVLELRLDRITVASGTYPVATSTMERTLKGKGGRTAKFAGGGGAFGALVGGLAGGGKGALIGALAGAGAGTAGSAVTGNKEVVLPAETLITFRLEKAISITQ
jgi:hypothetical protein